MKKIVTVKLVSGEFVVGTLHQDNPDFIENSYLINFTPSEDGRIGIELMPYMYPFSTTGIDLNISKALHMIDCPKELENAYIQTTTGIVIAPPEPPKGLSIVK